MQTTGYGVIEITPEGPRVAEAGVVRSSEGRVKAEFAERIKALYDGIVEVIDQWSPAAIAVEQLYAHYEHPRTAILMGHARGAFLLAGAQRGIPVLSYAATQVKKLITGHGHAGKEQMQYTIMRELGLVFQGQTNTSVLNGFPESLVLGNTSFSTFGEPLPRNESGGSPAAWRG